MSKKDRRKLEKKRRKERKQRRQKSVSLAYHGNKYKTDQFVELIFQTEAGIYESFVMADRKVTDHDVRRALENLIRDIRSGCVQFSAPPEDDDSASEENHQDLITWNVRWRWQDYLEECTQPSRDDIVGILRTILGSIEVWGTINPESRGYLRYLEGFMNKLGLRCEKVPPDYELPPAEDAAEDDELLAAGRAWIHDAEPGAATVFRALADEMIRSGEAEEVAEACQQLTGESADQKLIMELGELSIKAQNRSPPSRGGLLRALGRLLGK
jgi:hypothetical protein